MIFNFVTTQKSLISNLIPIFLKTIKINDNIEEKY